MSAVEAKLKGIIKKLEAHLEDAQKCDKGRAGAPGTRIRKTAQEVKAELTELRKLVIESRNA